MASAANLEPAKLIYAEAAMIVAGKYGPRPLLVPSTGWSGYRSNSDTDEKAHFLRVLNADTAARAWDRRVAIVMNGGPL